MATHCDRERFHAESVEARGAWLKANHDRIDGVRLVTGKVAAGRPRVTYEESVVEALSVGWVDGLGNMLGDERRPFWFSPRNPSSGSRPNKERIEPLEREGRMLAAERRTVDIAKANVSWRGVRQWIVRAKRASTRAKRFAEAAEEALRGERANRWLRA